MIEQQKNVKQMTKITWEKNTKITIKSRKKNIFKIYFLNEIQFSIIFMTLSLASA